MIYTLQQGYDKQLKKRIEKIAVFGVPLAIMVIIGAASLTNNITHIINRPSPGGGSSTSQAADSNKKDGDSSVAGSWTNTAASQKSASSGSTGMTGANTTQSQSPASAAQRTAGGGSSSLPVVGGRGGGEESSKPTLPVTTAPVTDPLPSTPVVVNPPSGDCGCSNTSGGGNSSSKDDSQPIDLGVSVGGLDAGVNVDPGGLVGGLGL